MLNVELNTVYHIRDLGFIFDSKMNFNLHIDMYMNKSDQLLGFISTCKAFNSTSTILIYCSVVWSPIHTRNY